MKPELPTGSPRCVCGGCGLPFKSVSAFDAHRVGPASDRRCLTTEELVIKGFEPNELGFWRMPFDRSKAVAK